jgi:hypothetical protein
MMTNWKILPNGNVEVTLSFNGAEQTEVWGWADWEKSNRAAIRGSLFVMNDIVDFAANGNPVEPTYLGEVLDCYLDLCDRLAETPSIPEDFLKLCAGHLSGRASKRKGPRIAYDGRRNSWIIMRAAVSFFHRARQQGYGYEEALMIVAKDIAVSEKTLEKWLSRFPSPNAPNK